MIHISDEQANDEIAIPESVAVCPDCHGKLTINPDGWELGDDGWYCNSFISSCSSEPDIDNRKAWKEFDESHPSFDMPYVYWLPIDIKIERWLKVNYRFDLKDEP